MKAVIQINTTILKKATNGRLTEHYLDPEPRHANLALQLIFARIN